MLWEDINQKKEKNSPETKLDAWKFEFVLDKNVDSMNDERYSSCARRMYKFRSKKIITTNCSQCLERNYMLNHIMTLN